MLSNDEYEQLGCLKEILSTSRVVRDMTKEWLVEASLSQAPRGMAQENPPFIICFIIILSYNYLIS